MSFFDKRPKCPNCGARMDEDCYCFACGTSFHKESDSFSTRHKTESTASERDIPFSDEESWESLMDKEDIETAKWNNDTAYMNSAYEKQRAETVKGRGQFEDKYGTEIMRFYAKPIIPLKNILLILGFVFLMFSPVISIFFWILYAKEKKKGSDKNLLILTDRNLVVFHGDDKPGYNFDLAMYSGVELRPTKSGGKMIILRKKMDPNDMAPRNPATEWVSVCEPVGDADGIAREIEWVIEKLNK